MRIRVTIHKHLDSQAVSHVMIFDTTSRVLGNHVWPYPTGAKGDAEVFTPGPLYAFEAGKKPMTIGAT
jgi:hypothetical protein